MNTVENPPRTTEAASNRAPPTLRLEKIFKTFRATRALDDVSLTVNPGEVHGLLGANGSGKSTLVKILAGFHAPDPGGTMRFNGEEVSLPLMPSDFRRLGMSFVHQNLGLISSLTVLENLRLAQIALPGGHFINWRREKAAAELTLARYGLDIAHWRRVDELSAVNRALLAIVRAFEEIRVECDRTGKPGLVLLDEPTPFLPREGVEQLFRLIRQITDHGSSVLFISHDIDEVMEITDRATILRDGRVSGETVTRDATHEKMIEMIIGRSLARAGTVEHVERRFDPFISVSGLEGTGIGTCSLQVGRGEIVGLTGLIGSGYERIPYLLYGATRAKAGSMVIDGGPELPVAEMTPMRSLQENFALLPGDRPTQGGVGSLPVYENMLLPDIGSYFRGGLLRNGQMRGEARRLGDEYEVRPNDPDLNLAALSGGNAQKVLIARCMKSKPRLLMLDEPTQGVDVGTRASIFQALRSAAADGMSVMCASSDSEQLAEICDRVLVFARGRIVDELTGASLEKDHITKACYASLDLARRTAKQEQAVSQTGHNHE